MGSRRCRKASGDDYVAQSDENRYTLDMNLAHWLIEHWSHLIENLGLPVTLIVAGITFHNDAKVRRVETLFKINEHHRDLWMHFYSRPDLAGIRDAKRDIAAKPPTGEEFHFVNLLFLHLNAVFKASKAGVATSPEHLTDDVRSFFSLPVPKTAWHRFKAYHDRDFIAFVERALSPASS